MRFFSSKYFKLFAFAVGAALLYNESVNNRNKDFDIFIAASRLVSEGKNCYEVWLHSGTSGLKYFYSPLFAVLLFPLTEASQVTCNFLWLSLNMILVVRIFGLLRFFLPITKLQPTLLALFYILVVATTGRFFYDTFCLGQMTILLVWGSLESIRLLLTGKTLFGSALLALIINIKIIPIALFAYLIYRREMKSVVYTVLFSLLFLFLPAVFIGVKFNDELLAQWFSSLRNTSTNTIMDDYGRQSLSSFFPALLMDTPLQFSMKRNIISLAPGTVEFILNLARLLLLMILAYLFGKPFRRESDPSKLFYDIALVCLITPLFFPHQGKYSFFYLFPAQAYCAFNFVQFLGAERKNMSKKRKVALTFWVISFVFLTLTTDGLIGRYLSDLAEYYNLITLGALCLLGATILLRNATEGGMAHEDRAVKN